jgi:hypothetical protein
VAERRAKVLRLFAPTNESARLRSHGVGHREIARREDSRNLGPSPRQARSPASLQTQGDVDGRVSRAPPWSARPCSG